VNFSNFKVRACTWEEVDFVKKYIQTTDFNILANSVRWGLKRPGRPYLLKLLEWSTVGNDKEYGHPKIFPEDLLSSFLEFLLRKRAEPTGLEPATSSVTGRRSNQLSYGS
jgi:hypothetical protein